MFRVKTICIFSALVLGQLYAAATVEAGPLRDWLFKRRCCKPVQTFRPAVPACGTCTTTCEQTCQRVVVNYVPYTAYRASWERVPVTTYRQTTSTDPCTGCTVTCNRPCTTYTWRMKQEPYTTYRPVYRTETYKVPVTYTTPAPAVAAPACNTCQLPAAVPTQVAQPTTTPYYQTPTPAAGGSSVTYEPMPATGTTVPAETRPSLKPATDGAGFEIRSQTIQQPNNTANYRPIQDPTPAQRWNANDAPQLLNPFNKSASAAPAVERWNYSPVRLASFQQPVQESAPVAAESNEYVGSLQRSVETDLRKPASTTRVNEGWRRD